MCLRILVGISPNMAWLPQGDCHLSYPQLGVHRECSKTSLAQTTMSDAAKLYLAKTSVCPKMSLDDGEGVEEPVKGFGKFWSRLRIGHPSNLKELAVLLQKDTLGSHRHISRIRRFPRQVHGARDIEAGCGHLQKLDLRCVFNSTITFRLFDFTTGSRVTRNASDLIDLLVQRSIPISVAILPDENEGARVTFATFGDGTVVLPPLALLTMTFNESWLEGRAAKQVASVLAHEAWHVFQLFNGIWNDFDNYPLTVDIEYEAFVVGAVVWNNFRNFQADSFLDAGSVCVAAGEATCKEILALSYSGQPRKPGG